MTANLHNCKGNFLCLGTFPMVRTCIYYRNTTAGTNSNNLNFIDMCKIKQLNGDAPRSNNYCTAREYEVFTIIAKNEELKTGDLIDGEKLVNKTAGRIWEITECNRTEGGHVTIKDNKGNEKTCMFVFGKSGKKNNHRKNGTATGNSTGGGRNKGTNK